MADEELGAEIGFMEGEPIILSGTLAATEAAVPDLTGATVVINIRRRHASALIVPGHPVDVTDAAARAVKYDSSVASPGVVFPKGKYTYDFVVTYPVTGRKLPYPKRNPRRFYVRGVADTLDPV